MEFAGWRSLRKHSVHSSSGGLLNNGVYSSETADIIEIDNDASEDSSSSHTDTNHGKSSEKCLDAAKYDEHLRMSPLSDSAAILVTDSVDTVMNGSSVVLQRSSDSDDKVTVETVIPANLCPESIDGIGKLDTAGMAKSEEGETKPGKDDCLGSASDKLVCLASDSSTDVVDLEEEILMRAAAVLGSVPEGSTGGDSVNVHHVLDSGAISQQPSVGGNVDGGLSDTDSADSGDATETSMVPLTGNQDKVDRDIDEPLSDDSVICLDNDEDDDNGNFCKTKAKESAPHRKLPVYIQVVNRKLSNAKIGSIASACPSPLSGSTVVRSGVSSSSSTLLKSGSSLFPTNATPVSKTLTTSWLMKSVFPVIDSSNQPTERKRCPRAMARLLGDIGLQLVSRRVHENRVAQQKRKLRKSPVKKSNSDALDKLLNLAVDPALTSHLQLNLQSCSCGFTTESTNVLELHYETGHESCGLQRCCLCEDYSARYPGQFVRHMELDHGRKVRVPPKPPTYLCPLCYFDTTGRAVYEKHVKLCQNVFVLRTNQKPAANHSDIPIDKTEPTKPGPVNSAVDLQPKAVSAQNEPVRTKSSLLAGERGRQQNLLRIGSRLFIVVSKPGDNVASSSLLPTTVSHLSLLHADKRLSSLTKTTLAMTRATGQSASLAQSAGQSSLRSSRVASGLLATSVLPLSTKSVTKDSLWASKMAEAVVNSVISSSRPAASKILSQPSLKTSSTTVSRLVSTNEPSCSMSPASNSTTVAKRQPKNHLDPLGHSNMTTSTVSGSPSFNIPPRNSLLPTVMIVPATTSIHVLASPVVSKPIVAKCNSVAVPSVSSQSNGYIICPVCSGFIKDVQALDIHMRIAHSDWAAKLFKCAKCVPIKWYSTRDALFKHQLSCHNICKGNVQGYCCRCEETGISDLIEHFRQNHGITLSSMYKSRSCSLCPMQLEGQRAFESHMISTHKNLFPSLSCLQTKIRSSGPKNSCRLCHKDDIVNLVRHMENRHQLTLNEMLRQVYCYFCSSRLKDTLSFENHMLQVHKNVFSSLDTLWDEIFTRRITSGVSEVTDGFCGAFKCSFCDDEFVSASYRYRHLVISHPKRSFVCSLCGISCGSKQSLMRHLKLRHTRPCSVSVQRLERDTFEKHYHCTENSCSASSIDLCSSPGETVVITDEDDDEVPGPLLKKLRLISDRGSLESRNIPPDSIEEVVEIDGDTVIIVQESNCC